MVEVGRDLWSSSGPNSLLKQTTQSQLPRTVARRLSNISKEGDSTTSLTVEQCFLLFRRHLLCFRLCPLPLVLSLGTTESLAPFLQVFLYIYEIP